MKTTKPAKVGKRTKKQVTMSFYVMKLVNGEELVGLGHLLDDGVYLQNPMLFTTSSPSQVAILAPYLMLSTHDDLFIPAHSVVTVTEGSGKMREFYELNISSGVGALTQTYLDQLIQNSIDLINLKTDSSDDQKVSIEESPKIEESAVDRLMRIAKECGKA